MKSSLVGIVASCVAVPLVSVSCGTDYNKSTPSSASPTQNSISKSAEKEAYKQKHGLYQVKKDMEPWEYYKPKCVGMICGPLDWDGINALSLGQRNKWDDHMENYFRELKKYYEKKLGNKQTSLNIPFSYTLEGL